MKLIIPDTKAIPIPKYGCFAMIKEEILYTAPMLVDGSMEEDSWSEVSDPAPGFLEELYFILERQSNR